MLHPDTELVFINELVGRGIRATRDIPRGTIIYCLDRFDVILSPTQVAALPPAHREIADIYGYIDPQGRCVVCWDNARFMNHACDANVRACGPMFQITVRDVSAGEELTCDYAECNLDVPMPCHCGRAGCRRSVHGRDLLVHADAWDREVMEAISYSLQVPQPVWAYLGEPEAARAILEGRVPMPSMRTLYYRGNYAVDRASNGVHHGAEAHAK